MISIIIPTHNRVNILAKTLSILVSLKDETDIEIIVVDNNSTDTTKQTIIQMQNAHANLIQYVYEERRASSVARNAGIRQAKGDITLLLDDDVSVQPGALRKIREVFDKFPQCGMIAAQVKPHFESEPPAWALDCEKSYNGWSLYYPGNIPRLENGFQEDTWAIGAMQTMRTDLLNRVGGYPDDLVVIETSAGSGNYFRLDIGASDSALAANVIKNGYKILYVPEVCGHHLVPNSRLTAAFWRARMISEAHYHSTSRRGFWNYPPSRLLIERKQHQVKLFSTLAKLHTKLSHEQSPGQGIFVEEMWAYYYKTSLELARLFRIYPNLHSQLVSISHTGVPPGYDVMSHFPKEYRDFINTMMVSAHKPIASEEEIRAFIESINQDVRSECSSTESAIAAIYSLFSPPQPIDEIHNVLSSNTHHDRAKKLIEAAILVIPGDTELVKWHAALQTATRSDSNDIGSIEKLCRNRTNDEEILALCKENGMLSIPPAVSTIKSLPPEQNLRIRIVSYEDLDLWILGKFASKLRDQLILLGVQCDIAKFPDQNADINHHIHYYYYDGKPSTTDTVMITHIDADWKLEQVRNQLNFARMGICMSVETVNKLAKFGIPREKLCYALPAHDQVMKPRPYAIGITSKIHSDGRKREAMLAQLADQINPQEFMFKIMGAGWNLIVDNLRNKGFEVEYFDAFDYELNKRLVPTFDYYLYLGLDEGAMGFIDALAAGIPTIVTPQGYHLEAPNGITHPFTTFDELVEVFKTITDRRKILTDSVADWTWMEYARKHLEIWEYVLYGKRVANKSSLRKDGFASIVESSDTHQSSFPVTQQISTDQPDSKRSAKKILIAISHFWPSIGGLENRVEQFSAALVEAGYEVTVITPDFPGRTSYVHNGVQIQSIDPSNVINGIPAWPSTVRHSLMSGNFDTCILIQDPLGNIIWSVEGATPPPSTRLIIQPIINADGYSKWKNHEQFGPRLAGILKGADSAVAMTKTGPENQFMHEFGINPVHIPNASSVPEPAGDFRARYKITADRFLILHVANLYLVKNHIGLLESLHDMPDSWLLVMVGNPSGEPECAKTVMEAINRRPDVLFIPGLSREWVSAAMNASDVIVLSSLGEGAPNTILEAMASGKPWLATPQCGAANNHAGGIICNLASFKEYLAILKSNPELRQLLGDLGKRHWQSCLSWPKVIAGWIDLIETGSLHETFEMPSEIKDIMDRINDMISSVLKKTTPFVLPESRHAHHWLDGSRGLEIGPSAQNPFGLNTRYVGMSDKIYENEQLRLAGSAVSLDIEALADNIPLPDESEDFILSSHVIEHCPDVIATLLEWFRIVRKGGIIYMIVPLRNAARSDVGKEITSWSHILVDFNNQANEHTEPEAGNFGHCHYHVFDIDSMREIVRNVFNDRLQLVDYLEKDDKVGNGFTLVYRKTFSITESIPWLFWEQFNAKALDKRKIVNICMVTFNRLEFTRQAIAAVAEHTDYPYALTVVDNNSQDGSRDYLQQLKDRGVIKNLVLLDKNIGIAKASNLAWSLEPTAEYYLKLDNDIVIKKKFWLSDMVRVIEGVPKIGAVAYNFEPVSYPLTDLNNIQVRIKNGNLGGACFLISCSTRERIGYWCEDYGLYSEEDYDYCYRMTLAGISYAYMEDEDIGIHLPAGKAAIINFENLEARDGVEEENQRDYRLWKDEIRRQVIGSGIRNRNIIAYNNGAKSLYAASESAAKWTGNGRPGLVASTAPAPQTTRPLKIAVFSMDLKEHACGHYRIQAPLRELAGEVEFSWGVTLKGKTFHIIPGVAQAADIIVAQRFFPQPDTAGFLDDLCSLGKPIIFEIDDLLTQLPTTNPHYASGMHYAPHINEFIRKCSAVTVTTEELKNHFSSYNDTIHMLPNLLDSDLWCKTSPPSSGPIVIGYAGTITHTADLELLEEVLGRIASRYKNKVAFTFIGCATKRISRLPGFSYIEFDTTFEAYAMKLQETPIDIMLAPLEDNPFNRCKSNIKWLEYSSCGIAGVYADLPPYNSSIEQGVTGLLAGSDPQQWFNAIDLLIKKPELRRSIALKARQKVMSEHTLKVGAPRWLQAYREITSLHAARDAKSANNPAVPSKNDAQHPNAPNRKKFSIIIMTWNRAAMLDLCLKSLFKNLLSRDECEIIIGDNGSSDSTAEVISRYQIDKHIRKTSNIGLELYHELFDLAQGEYLIELDDDVLDLPFGFEKKFAEYFASFPDYGLIGLDVVQNEHTNGAKPDKSAYREDARGNLTIEEGVTGGWCLCLKRLTFEQIGKFGGLVLSMAQSEDGVLWKRVQAHGMRAGIIKDMRCFHASGPYFSQKYGYVERDNEKYAISGLILWNNRFYRKDKLTASGPVISIIVPLFNRVDFTKKCIAAIQRTVSKLIYELILVDNNSNDATKEYLQTLGDQVRVITNNTNLGFAKACNKGAKAALGEYLLFLNNDTEPQHGWLEPLVDNLISDDSVAAVGSKLLYPDGTIQHAGIVMVDDRKNNDHLLAKNNHVGKPADAPEANIPTLHQALTAACVLIRKSAFEKAGGFDEKYWNGYEDVDLCFKLQQHGGKLVYQPASVVIHHESQSGPERFAKAPENIKRLHKKWLGKIKPDIILNKNGTMTLTNAGKIRPYSTPGLPQNQLVSKVSTPQPNLVSIVILTFNELKYTRECVESIKKHTPEPHEIIFVDNASTDGTVKWLRKISQENPSYKLIENKNNLGFAKGCNLGIEETSGEYILLLNNDVVVTENWLSGMLECLNSAPDTGIVGPMTNNISGPQKVLDADYNAITKMFEYAKSFRERYRHRRVASRRIVGFCMLLRHTLVDKIGLLDESFGTGNFEDDDYCLRATLAGCRNLIAGDVFIHHYGSRSFIGNKIDYGSSISGNIQIFDEKWMGIDVNAPLGKKFTAFNFIEKADKLSQKGHFDKAIAMFIEGIKYAPEEKIVYYRLAEMLLDAKLYKDALETIQSMPQGSENDLKRLEIIAYCTEGIDEAEKLVGRILAIDKDYAPALNLKGMNAYKRGDNQTAADFFKNAIASDPSYGEPYTNLGIMKWASDQKDEALDWLEKGFILSPTIMDNVNLYHTAVTELEVFERAEKLFRNARELYRENKRILFFLIDILIRQCKFDNAIHEIEQAMMDIGIDDGMLAAALEIREKVGIKEIGKAARDKGTLSLCMIVKNEEQHLTRCLMSAMSAVDEIIIVDTGSTDRTKDIARAFGAKVFDFQWTNDFSEARNVSLSKATGDWILVLDADEVISPLDHPAIERIIKKKLSKPVGYSLNTRNYTNEVNSKGWIANDRKYLREEAGTGWFPSAKVRLFVNDKRIQFQNPVHEFVEGTMEAAGIEIKNSNIPVHHYGRFDKDKILAKGREYFLLGKKKIDQMNDDLKALKELAIQASELGEYDTAVGLWKRVIELNPNDPAAFLNIGYAYMKLEKYENALSSSHRVMELDPSMKEGALNYAGSEFIVGDITKTIFILEQLLRKESDYPPAMALVGAAYYVDGQKVKSLDIFKKLRKKRFDCTEFFDEQIRALMSQGRFAQAFSLLEAAVKTESVNKDTKTLLAECHSKMVSKEND